MSEVAVDLKIVGRDREVAEIAALLDAAKGGAPAILLIGGDAGIGKTALVEQTNALAEDRGFRVLQGNCLDISAHIPFRPVVEALRPLISGRGTGTTTPGGPALARLADLVREGGGASAMPAGELFDLLRQCLHEVASDRPVLLVIEDMHWSGQSTRDFVTAVAGSLTGPLVVVLTFRTDDLHRRHPFRSCLVGLARLPQSHRVELAPLDHAGVAALVTRRTGGDSAPGHVSALLARGEGNPLYTEELLAAEAGNEQLPDGLSDLLLARVEALSHSSRAVLRFASVTGSRIDTDLLPELADLSTEQVEAALREAADYNVVVRRGDHLEFRHGLIREAVYDRLLPGERSRLHARFAATLAHRAVPDGASALAVQARLAYHWYEAHDLPAALAASFEAGRLSLRFGVPEAALHLDRALDLWDQVPDAPERTGVEKTDVLRLAALDADLRDDPDRAELLIRSALELVGEDTDPLAVSRAYATYAAVSTGIEGLIDLDTALDRAVAYADVGRDSKELAEALVEQAAWRGRCGRFSESERIAGRAVEVAARIDFDDGECRARAVLGANDRVMGHFEAGDAQHRAILAVRRRTGRMADLLLDEANMAWFLLLRGQPERCIEIGRWVTERAAPAAMGMPWFLGMEQVAGALVFAGRLDEADACFQQMRASGEQPRRFQYEYSWLMLARGEAQTALDLARVDPSDREPPGVFSWPDIFERRIDLLLACGATSDAVDRVSRQLAPLASELAPMLEVVSLAAGLRVAATAHGDGTMLPEGFLPEVESRWQRVEDVWVSEWDPTWYGGHHSAGRAWWARAHGDVDPEAWRAAVEHWASMGFHLAALSLAPRLAEDLLAAGRRDEAREVLVGTWSEVRRRGMRGVEAETAALARRHRIALPDSPELEPSELLHLTPRERDVLDLMATGATNRAIAERLVISEKTVSVHVSHVLTKLGVANRGEAAAVALSIAARESTDAGQ